MNGNKKNNTFKNLEIIWEKKGKINQTDVWSNQYIFKNKIVTKKRLKKINNEENDDLRVIKNFFKKNFITENTEKFLLNFEPEPKIAYQIFLKKKIIDLIKKENK